MKKVFTNVLFTAGFLLIGLSLANGQCSSLDVKVKKAIRNWNNTADSVVSYITKDSSCTPYTLKLNVTGYGSGYKFKYTVAGSSLTTSLDTFQKLIFKDGYYSVQVELIDNNGTSVCTWFKDSMVRVGVAITPDIRISDTLLCNGPDTVTICDSTVNILSRQWYIDGVSKGTNKCITHVFTSTGYKKIECFLIGFDSCQRYLELDSVIRIMQPVSVDFSAANATGCKAHSTGYTPSFNLNGQTISTYNWAFTGGNPSTSTSQNPGNIVYGNAGAYGTSLQVTTNLGCTYNNSKNNYINVGDTFNLNFTIDDSNITTKSTCINKSIRIKNTTTGLPSGSSTWTVSGAKTTTNTTVKDSFNVFFDVPRTYNVKYEFNYNSCKSTANFSLKVSGPQAAFTLPNNKFSNCSAPYTVKLINDSKTDSSIGGVTFHWLVGDSAGGTYKTSGAGLKKFTFNGARVDTSMGAFIFYNTDTPTVTFNKFGYYTIKQILVGANGCKDSMTRNNYFSIKAPNAILRMDDSISSKTVKFLCPCDKIKFKSQSNFSGDSIRHWYSVFKFPDTTNAVYSDTSNIPISKADTLNYRFCGSTNDSFLVRLIDYTDFGCRDTVYDTLRIKAPSASFTIDVKQLCVNGSNASNFTSTTTPAIGSLVHRYYAKHKDSTFWYKLDTTANINTQFMVAGIYSIAYSVKTKGGSCMDSIVKIDSIVVKDIQFDVISASSFGCKNSAIKFDTSDLKLIGNTPATVKYTWTTNPSANVTISTPNKASTNITFGDNGKYSITLKIEDTITGCFKELEKSNMIDIGVIASFAFSSSIGCRNTCNRPNNVSSANATSFQWTSTPATKGGKPVIIDTATANGYSPASPCIAFPDTGNYRIVLKGNAGSCFDNDTQYITIEKSEPDFYATQTLFSCAPQSVTFINKSTNTTALYWDFGNGNQKSTSAAADTLKELYKTNDSCRDVTLIGTSTNGCTDTMTKKCYLKFSGPVPKYSISNYIGCEPLTVQFTDQSYNITNKDFDFGDGTTTSGSFTSHKYTTSDTSLYTTYKTILVASGAGCPQPAYYPDVNAGQYVDSIVVYKKAICYFYVDTTQECEPYAFQFYDTSKYATNWKWNFGDGSAIDTTKNPIHVYQAGGLFTVKLNVSNGSGCADSMTKAAYITVRSRAKPAFSINDSVGCQTLVATFTDASQYTTSRKWYFGDTSNSSSTNPTHTYAPGTYTPMLVCNNQYGCKDSITKNMLVNVFYNAVPKIYGTPLQGCEPFSTKLYGDSSSRTDTFTWVVLSGLTPVDTFTSINPSFSLSPGSYHVVLVANNVNNCPVSMTRNNYITVYNRARPSYTLVDSFGCDTLVTKFTNTSIFANYYRWEFNRGTNDTSNNANPTVGFGPKYYSIKLYASNANGCADSIIQAKQIHVADKSKPKVYSNSIVGCEPFCTQLFGDSSTFTTQWEWDFENDGTVDATTTNPNKCYTPGTYTVKLSTNNQWGCTNVLTLPNFIKVYTKPVADYIVDYNELCFQQSVNFTDLSTSDVPLVKWWWSYGDSTLDTVQFPSSHIYTYPGLKTTSLAVMNSNGCLDTLTIPDFIFMNDSLPPTPTKIQYATVTANNDIEVYWQVNGDSTFFENKLYHSDGTAFINVYSSTLLSDVQYTDIYPASVDPTARSYSYVITTSDSCGWISQPDTIHKTMWLQAATLAPMTNVLNWTPYVGWGACLSEYKIYRGARDKFNPNPPVYEYYRSLMPTDTTMIDSLLCDSNYVYYVTAVHCGGTWVSTSNQANNSATFISPDTAVSLKSVTVVNNKNPFLQWNASTFPAVKNYIIDKYESGQWRIAYDKRPPSILYYTDLNNVDVQKNNYMYRVGIEDYCGNYSPVSTDVGRTILLDASIVSDMVTLEWTPYIEWTNTVREYQLQIQYGPNDWRPVATVPGTDVKYVDQNVYEDLYTNYCYRVVAIENNALPDTSISNVDCAVVPSRIFVANSFSPNSKGPVQNETFKPVGISIFSNQVDNEVNDYVFQVYNKWGERVFETHQLSKGWDGSFKGKPSSDDVYIWTIRARGRDGYPYDMSGIVHLIR